jgi:hypothetical protein
MTKGRQVVALAGGPVAELLEKVMKKRRAALLVLLLLTVMTGIVMALVLRNPLRCASDKIRNSLLELAPLGGSEDQVSATLDSTGVKRWPGGRMEADSRVISIAGALAKARSAPTLAGMSISEKPDSFRGKSMSRRFGSSMRGPADRN